MLIIIARRCRVQLQGRLINSNCQLELLVCYFIAEVIADNVFQTPEICFYHKEISYKYWSKVVCLTGFKHCTVYIYDITPLLCNFFVLMHLCYNILTSFRLSGMLNKYYL